MPYLYVAHKREGADAVRTAHRIEHLEYMIHHQAVVLTGGSFESPDGSWGGMALILDLPDNDSADEWTTAEPYHRAGLFATTHLAPFRQLVPEPEPDLLARELLAERARSG
jgi:uncharacterized protein